MGYLADIYVIEKTRSKKLAIQFLNLFLPERVQSADDYSIPEYSETPSHQFKNPYDLMTYLELNKNISNSIYWRNTDEKNPNKHGMIFYNKDETMVFGISRNIGIKGGLDSKSEYQCLSEMKTFFNTHLGYIDYENPPVDNYKEFIKIVSELEK